MQKITEGNSVWSLFDEAADASTLPFSFTVLQRLYLPVKRLGDIVFSTAILIVLLPVFLVVSLLIKKEKLGSVFFKQQRVGKNGKLFNINKFRTMHSSAPNDIPTAQLHNVNRYIPKFGLFLRRTSIDEIPQFFNVLKGDMALIGPRPLVPGEKEMHLMRRQRGVYALRPGLTGLAQINGRDLVTPDEKVRYDEAYLRSMGLWRDISIFLQTIVTVATGKGVAEGHRVAHRNGEDIGVPHRTPAGESGDDVSAHDYVYDKAGST